MTTLLALGFPYSTSADAAAQDIALQEPDLATEPDAVAVVSCRHNGAFHVTTTHTLRHEGHRFFWQLLLTALIFLPASRTLTEQDPRPSAGVWRISGSTGPSRRGCARCAAPDTSALFLLTTRSVPADALTALGRFGGKLLAAPLASDIETRLMHAIQEAREFEPVPTEAMLVDEDPSTPAFPRALPKSRSTLDGSDSSCPHDTTQDGRPGTR